MAHKALIGGTAYSITGGRTLIGGTGYGISKGRTLIGGTGYDISFVTGTPLSDFTAGSIVKLNESGSPVEFYVAKHDYESGLNGTGRTLLVRKGACTNLVFGSTSRYSESNIHTWLTNTYKGRLDTAVQSAIALTSGRMTIPCIYGGGSTAGIYMYTDIFLLSATELGKTDLGSDYDGTTLDIASTLKVAYLNGSAVSQWTRTPYNYSGETTYAYYCYLTGVILGISCTNAYGVRPCFTLPGTTLVDADNNIVV